jgi:hypothetical protein
MERNLLQASRCTMNSRPIVINQSSYGTFADCQRKYGWWRLERLEPVLRRSALEIGTAVHAGLATYHAEGGTLEAAQSIAREKLTEAAGPAARFEDKTLDEAQDIVDRVLPAYFEHWGDAGEAWTPLNNEVQFLVEVQPGWAQLVLTTRIESVHERDALREKLAALPHTGVFLRGRADNLSVHAGGLWLVDYKTAAKMDPRDLMKYELDLQVSSYIYGLTKVLTEESLERGEEPVIIRGMIIDLLVKTTVPQFAREQYTRSVAELAEFELEFIEIGNRIRAQRDRVEAGEDWKIVFPKNTKECFRYGTCAYRDLCLKDTPVRRAAYDSAKPDYVTEAQAQLDEEYATKQMTVMLDKFGFRVDELGAKMRAALACPVCGAAVTRIDAECVECIRCFNKTDVYEAQKAAAGICEHGNTMPDPECGCGT